MREIKFRLRDWEQMHYDYPDRYPWDWCNPFKGLDDHLIIMQYTWLKDKNSEEIYEGDILQCIESEYKEAFSVIFWNWSYHCQRHEWTVWLGRELWPFLTSDECIVIWNIYENPDLLSN